MVWKSMKMFWLFWIKYWRVKGEDGKYYCIAKDHAGSKENSLTELGKALILFESESFVLGG